MSAKSLVRIFLILLKRAYRYAVSLGKLGTLVTSGLTSSQYTDPVRHTHNRQVGRSVTQHKHQAFFRMKRIVDNRPMRILHLESPQLPITFPFET